MAGHAILGGHPRPPQASADVVRKIFQGPAMIAAMKRTVAECSGHRDWAFGPIVQEVGKVRLCPADGSLDSVRRTPRMSERLRWEHDEF